MEKKEYLNEQTYQSNKKKIKVVAVVILIIGILLGGSLIFSGINKQNKINYKYSKENQTNITNQLQTEKTNLQTKITELKNKGIKSSRNYQDGEAYDLYILTNVLDPSFDHCAFDEYKNNTLTSKYCTLKNDLEHISNGFNKSFDSHDSIPLYMFGAFIIIASSMIAFSVYMVAKRRELLAFGIQQVMPLAEETVEKITPTMAKAGATIAKEMAPAYGEIAKEISKGIKEGMKKDEE